MNSKLTLTLAGCFLLEFCLSHFGVGQSLSIGAGASAEFPRGVVIETIGHNSEAEKAGLLEGDILLRWFQGESQNEIQSPFDLWWLEVEERPRGAITIRGLRGGESQTWTLGSAAWDVVTRPNLAEPVLSIYRQSQDLAKAGKLTEALSGWRNLAASAAPSWLSAWFLFHAADSLAEARQWAEAGRAYEDAARQAGSAGPIGAARIFRRWARMFQERNDWANAESRYQQSAAESQKVSGENFAVAINFDSICELALISGDPARGEKYCRQALDIRQKLAPGSLDVALSLYHFGWLAQSRGELGNAEEYYRRALEIREKLAPGSLDVAASLNTLGAVAIDRSDLNWAEQCFRQALGIQEKLTPGSLSVAASLSNLSQVALRRGDLAKAEEYLRESLEIQEKLAPGNLNMATSLNNLGTVAFDRGDLPKAEQYHRQALEIREKLAPASLDVAASLNNLGRIAEQRGDLAKAEENYHHARDVQEKLAPGTLILATILNNLGRVADHRGDFAKAEQYSLQALGICEKIAPESLDVAASLSNLGTVAVDRGDLAKAEQYYRQALEIREKLAPASLTVGATLNNLGIVVWHRGDLAQAEEYFRRSLEIQEKVAPGKLAVAAMLNNLGAVAWQRGDLAKAEQYFRQALEIRQNQAADSLDVAGSLNNLAAVVVERGNLAQAEEYYRQALGIQKKLAPGSLDVALSLANLGFVASRREDLINAEKHFLESLEIREKLAPGSLDVAASFSNLGYVTWRRGDLAQADQYYRQALAIEEKLAPGSLTVAESLNSLALAAQQKGDLAEAERYYRKALAIEEKLGPDSLLIANTTQGLGETARKSGDPEKAEHYYTKVLSIRERLAPGSQDHAELLAALASILRDKGQLDSAAHLFEEALGALESQLSRLGGGSEIRAQFRAGHAAYYAGYIDILMKQSKPEQAFQILERSRAQTLREMLAEGNIDIRKGVDSRLMEQQASLRAAIRAQSNRRLELLGGHHSAEQVTAMNKEIEDLLSKYEEIEGQIRIGSPSYAALTLKAPLSAREIQEQLLDPDTVLLEYALGEERSYVWVISQTDMISHELSSRTTIEAAAQRVRDLITARNRSLAGETRPQRETRLAASDAAYKQAAQELSRLVLGPVAGDIRRRRLLVVSDGALQYIPFALLPMARSYGEPGTQPLVVEHEIIHLPSASVLAVLRHDAMKRSKAAKKVAVLADPVFSEEDVRVRAASKGAPGKRRMGSSPTALSDERLMRALADASPLTGGAEYLQRLPFTRREARAILSLLPQEQVMAALGFDANRDRATSGELAGYQFIHFATHGLFNDEHPELSGLVFSLFDRNGKRQNGFLDMEDIYNLNLPVDLVVLSACETGLGKNVKGEGLVGLTRAFMYAGASRVLASLWKVEDEATSELMSRFYEALLHGGLAPSAALRKAQLEMLNQERWSHPYYWAAFTLQGEWQITAQ